MALSKILIIGATGHIGRHIANASILAGHPTYLLLRDQTDPTPERLELIEQYRTAGATILKGSLDDFETLVVSIKKVDVVISTVPESALADQHNLISAIQEAGNVKRFIPSEYGIDVDRNLNELVRLKLGVKVEIRRAVERSGIPYTFVSCNSLFHYFIVNLTQLGRGHSYTSPPRDKVVMYGDGTAKSFFVAEEDVAKYIIKAVDDPRTVNKIMYIRPPGNMLSQKDLFELWERMIGVTLEKKVITEEDLFKQMQELPYPKNLVPAMGHALYIQGIEDFEIGPQGIEAIDLYGGEMPYITVEQFLHQFL